MSSSGGRVMSMDLNLTSEDFILDGGQGAMPSDGFDRLQSSDIVECLLDLPDPAVTAGVALKVGQRAAAANNDTIVKLTAHMERVSTGESVVPLKDDLRVSSRDWVNDFAADSQGMGAMHPSLFTDNPSSRSLDSTRNAAPSPIPLGNSLAGNSFEEYQVPPILPTKSSVNSQPPCATQKITAPSSSTTSKKTKRKRKRIIDVTNSINPTEDDVLFGRGGYTNTHRGNINFREEAQKLRPWYESSTKEEKFVISQMLIESVKNKGHRFLEKGNDGMWHEVIGNGARKKASQALRERVKKKKYGEDIGRDSMPDDVVGV